MIIINEGEVETKEDILRKEQEFIDLLIPTLNSKRAIKLT